MPFHIPGVRACAAVARAFGWAIPVGESPATLIAWWKDQESQFRCMKIDAVRVIGDSRLYCPGCFVDRVPAENLEVKQEHKLEVVSNVKNQNCAKCGKCLSTFSDPKECEDCTAAITIIKHAVEKIYLGIL